MHEYSIVASLIDVCEKQALKANASSVKSVTLRIGRLSGIEPHFMQSCFDTFKEDTICHDAILHMNIVAVKILCLTCKKEHEVKENNFFCPSCKSGETKMLQGQEMLVESIEILGNNG